MRCAPSVSAFIIDANRSPVEVRALVDHLPPPRPWRATRRLPETARQMRLIAKAADQRNLGNGVRGREQEMLRPFDPRRQHIDPVGHAFRGLERPGKMADAQVDQARDIDNVHRRFQISKDEMFDLAKLPYCQRIRRRRRLTSFGLHEAEGIFDPAPGDVAIHFEIVECLAKERGQEISVRPGP